MKLEAKLVNISQICNKKAKKSHFFYQNVSNMNNFY